MQQENRVPRFRAYFDRKRKALVMRRADWNRLFQQNEFPIEIDIEDTPMASISKNTQIVATFAEKTVDGKNLLTIFRNDPKDVPKIINFDKYEVWENIPSHIDYEDVVIACATSDDTDLRGFLDDNVFIVPLEKEADHHLADIPTVYKAILENNSDAS